MSVVQVFAEAMRSLRANRLRTALAMLGVIIGIGSVLMMLAIGDAVQVFIEQQLGFLGSNQLLIVPGSPAADGGVKRRADEVPSLTIDDALSLNSLASVRAAAPVVQSHFQLQFPDDNANLSVLGVTPSMLVIRNWQVEQGVGFDDGDVRSGNRVLLIGSGLARRYFDGRDVVGQTIRLEGQSFTVVGVLAGTGRLLDGTNLGELVLMPITAVPLRMPRPRTVHYISVQAMEASSMNDAIADVEDRLRDRHRIDGDKDDDFKIENLASIAEAGSTIGRGLSVGMGVIGVISLIVGGIGIMNIMLVSVSERVREIGIRMAIGAKPRDLLVQFLLEAVLLCLVGGAVGVLLARLCTFAINLSGEFKLVLTFRHILVATSFATAVGLFFGFYPARRASKLQPIECLRQE